MDESILVTIKKLLGLSENDNSFDVDIIIAINTALGFLYQLGLGSDNSYYISDGSDIWSSVLSSNHDLEMIKTYIYLRTRLIFDPPTSGTLVDALNKEISELEWRIGLLLEE